MKAPLHFRKTNINGVSCLVPTEEGAEDWLRRRKIGEVVAMSSDQVRNAARSALYWTLCGIVAENHPELKTKDEVSDALQVLCGLATVTAFDTSGGRIWMRRPRSLAFANMGEDEFQTYFNNALGAIGSELLPGVDVEELKNESYLRSGAAERRFGPPIGNAA